jgi:predicted nuclease with TOPRIM domain
VGDNSEDVAYIQEKLDKNYNVYDKLKKQYDEIEKKLTNLKFERFRRETKEFEEDEAFVKE